MALARIPLGDICHELYRYPTYYGIEYLEAGVPEVRGELITAAGSLDLDRQKWRFISSKTSARFPKTVLEEGDLVMSVRGTIGKVGLVPLDFCGANMTANLIRISPMRQKVYERYLWRYMRSPEFVTDLEGISSSTTIKTVKAPDLREMAVPLPPLAEQRRIAEVLDQAEVLRTQRRAAIAQLDALTQAIFLDLFGDPEGNPVELSTHPLDEFCSLFSGFAWKADKFSNGPAGIPVIRIQNVDTDRASECIFWPGDYEERFVIRRGDLLLTLSGSFRIAEWNGPDALLNQRIVRLDPKAGVERSWLLHAVRLLVEKIESIGRHALVNNVAISDLKQLRLIRPTLALQQDFARRIAAVDKLKAAHRASLAELDALFAALQHRAFRGEL